MSLTKKEHARDALKGIIKNLTGKLSADILADISESSPADIYKWGNLQNTQDITSPALVLLARGMCDHGITMLASLMLTPDYRIEKNTFGNATGEFDTKVAAITLAIAKLYQSRQTGNPGPANEAIKEIESALNDIRAEVCLLEHQWSKSDDQSK